ncbi:MAG: heme exporter protein CcmB [Planctomycetes bacterium]|nr:heme exporter protein CcmB [Planctomycetota bacterium]
MTETTVQPSFPRAVAALFAREVRVELRTKSLITSMGLFALLCVVIVGLGVRGLSNDETFQRFVLAMLWVCTMFAAVVGLNRAASADRRKDFFQALLILPHDAGLVFFVRLVSTLVFLLLTQAIMIVVAVPLLKLDFFDQPLMLLVIPLADLGVLAPGVLLSSATSRVRGGEALLTIALLPVAVPVFAGATGATERLQGGSGVAGAMPYVLLLVICCAMFTALGLLLYGRLNEG